MKKNDLLEIKNMDIANLTKKAIMLTKEVADLSLEKNMHKLKNFKSVAYTRKNLAQVLTVLRQKEIIDSLETENEK